MKETSKKSKQVELNIAIPMRSGLQTFWSTPKVSLQPDTRRYARNVRNINAIPKAATMFAPEFKRLKGNCISVFTQEYQLFKKTIMKQIISRTKNEMIKAHRKSLWRWVISPNLSISWLL